jgi:uncharacterized membrane protein YbjE (DUF340 family)
MKNSFIILLFFVAGVLLARFGETDFITDESKLSFYVLCALMFSVGVSVGGNKTILNAVRKINPRFFLLPLATIIGTLGGAFVAAFFLANYSLSEWLAVASGFGYYSLSSILITENSGAELGAIALMSNVLREIITLIFAPIMVKYFGKLAPISSGGATTMDTTLPIITRYSGEEMVMVSVVHGFMLDISVPFLVTFFCFLS